MRHTYETPTINDSRSNPDIRQEQSGVVVQFRNTPEAIARLNARRQEKSTHFEKERDHLRSEMIFLAHRQFTAPQAMN